MTCFTWTESPRLSAHGWESRRIETWPVSLVTLAAMSVGAGICANAKVERAKRLNAAAILALVLRTEPALPVLRDNIIKIVPDDRYLLKEIETIPR